ncbi:hypothetical protein LZ023_38960 (plasmid) [Pseudomonas silvicola]|nr:hypothetical protein LZ023_38960 [Pseudomonas silvicola]
MIGERKSPDTCAGSSCQAPHRCVQAEAEGLADIFINAGFGGGSRGAQCAWQ